MGRQKKTFPCGHVGYGQYCHKCAEREKRLAERKTEREAWSATFEKDVIDLRQLPKPLVAKSRELLSKLEDGEPWGNLGGKKLRHDRSIISIPINRDYRLICRFEDGKLIPVRADSHEDYYVKKPGAP